MSDYTRGKNMVIAWELHWDSIATFAESGKTSEAELLDYGVSIRAAFVTPNVPDIMLMAMPEYIRTTHYCVMTDMEAEQREAVIVWHFGDEAEKREHFGRINREPKKMTAIYERIARYHRGAKKRSRSCGPARVKKPLNGTMGV